MPVAFEIPEFEVITGTDINPNGTFPLRILQGASGPLNAFSGGGQASATALPFAFNLVSTSAATTPPFDSVVLPAAKSGLMIVVANTTANPIQVFGNGSDTINGIAGATGITQPPNSIEIFFCPTSAAWYVDPGIGYSGQLFTEYAQDSITAHAGGGQASATQIVAQTSRVTTVTTAGDSIKLPASAPGLELMIINHGGNTMQVFGSGTDTIDDVATATGVPQMVNSLVIYTCATAGAWYSEGLATGFGGPGLQTQSFANNLTAFATGGQASALQLTAMVNRVTTVATSGDSVKLPAAVSGLEVTAINRGANAMQVFGAGTDTINGVATATGISQPMNSVAMYVCSATGLWETDAVGQGFSGQLPTVSATNGITAHAGGGQGSAVLLTTVINRVTTVASANDSVILPASTAGLQLIVTNAAAANSMNVFPASGDAINALAVNTAFAIVAGKTASFSCAVTGTWHSVLSA